MNVVLSEKGGSGTLRLAGRAELPVTFAAATGKAGIFRMLGRSVAPSGTTVETSGWVVMPDGTVRGLRRLDRSGGSVTLSAAPKLDLKATRVTAQSLLPTCKPVKRAGAPSTTEPPGCGLPDGRTPRTPSTTGFVVTRRSKALGLTDAQLTAAAARSRVAALADARGRGLKLLTAEDRRAFDNYAKKITSKPTVLTAAERLRVAMLSGDLERIGARLSEYESALAVAGLAPLPPALQQRATARRGPLPTSAKVFTRGPSTPTFLTIPNSDYSFGTSASQSGSFVHFPIAQATASAPAPAGQVLLRTEAWVGWGSAVDLEAVAMARFKAPAGVREVEIELDVARSVDTWHTDCTLGSADAYASDLITVEQIKADGSTGTTYAGVSMADFGGFPPLCNLLPPFIQPFPVPDPPGITANAPLVFKFAPPADGGAFLIKLHAWAKAETVGAGEATATVRIWVKSTTVRFRR